MSEQAGTAVVDIVGNVAPLDASLAQAEASVRGAVTNMTRAFNQASQGMGGASRTTQQLEQRMRQLADTARNGYSQFTRMRAATQLVGLQFQTAQQAGLGFGQTITAMTGSIGLLAGVITGTLVAQAFVALGRALVQATSQFAEIRNEMQGVSVFSGNVASEFEFLRRVADNSNLSLKDLSKQYTQLSIEGRALGLSQDELRAKFEEFNRVLKERQQETVGSSFGKMLEDLGEMALKIDNSVGFTKLLITEFNSLRNIAKSIGGWFSPVTSELEEQQKLVIQLGQQLDLYEQGLKRAELSAIGREITERLIAKAIDDQEKAFLRIKELQEGTVRPEEDQRRVGTMRDINAQLELERTNFGLSNSEQEVRNRMFQFELQFRQQGKVLSETEKADLEVRLRMNQSLAETYDQLRESFGVFMDRVEGQRSILDEMNFSWFTHADAVEQAMERIKIAYGDGVDAQIRMAQIKRQLGLQEQRQMLDVASAAANAITVLWPKQKGAAIAAGLINTSVAVTKALSGSLPPYNFAMAALVGAAGLAQVAAIRSASPTGGGTIPAIGGGGVTPEAPAAPSADAGGRSVTIYMPKGEFFSSETLGKFIERINEEVQNGAILISTKQAPT